MITHEQKKIQFKSNAVANNVSRSKPRAGANIYMEDNRPETASLKTLQTMMSSGSRGNPGRKTSGIAEMWPSSPVVCQPKENEAQSYAKTIQRLVKVGGGLYNFQNKWDENGNPFLYNNARKRFKLNKIQTKNWDMSEVPDYGVPFPKRQKAIRENLRRGRPMSVKFSSRTAHFVPFLTYAFRHATPFDISVFHTETETGLKYPQIEDSYHTKIDDCDLTKKAVDEIFEEFKGEIEPIILAEDIRNKGTKTQWDADYTKYTARIDGIIADAEPEEDDTKKQKKEKIETAKNELKKLITKLTTRQAFAGSGGKEEQRKKLGLPKPTPRTKPTYYDFPPNEELIGRPKKRAKLI